MSDLSPETRSMLARGRDGHAISDGQRKRLKRALLAQIAGGAVITTTSGAAAWTSVAAKVTGMVMLVGVVGGGIAAEVVHQRGPVAPHVAPIARPLPPMPAVGSGAGRKRDEAPVPAQQVAPIPLPLAPISRGGERREDVPTPAAEIGGRQAVAPIPVTKPPAAAATASVFVTYAPIDPMDPAPSPAQSLAAEALALREAHQALSAGDPDTALRLLDEHARRFPASGLEPERSAERVFALCRAGRTAEAQRAAQIFLGAHGSGPLATRVEGSCGGQGK